MVGSIGVELNLAVGKSNCVLPNFILPTFTTCHLTELYVKMPIFNNTAYCTLPPNKITANISSYTVFTFYIHT